MKKLLVHLHIHYHDQIDYFIEKMKNINGINWDLNATLTNWNQDTVKKLKELKPDAKISLVENRGYDIWPFIKVIRDADLDNYDFVIKLHTKRDIRKCAANVIPMKGYEWRDALTDGILYSPEYFRHILEDFNRDNSIGMISNLKTYSKRNWDSYFPRVKEELEKLGLEAKGNHFCMGTMFMARSSVLAPLKSEAINKEIFKDTINDSKRDFTSAHYYERLLSILPDSLGLRHVAKSPVLKEKIWIKSARILEKPVRWIFGIEKKGPHKRKFIRILGLEFYIQSDKPISQNENNIT